MEFIIHPVVHISPLASHVFVSESALIVLR